MKICKVRASVLLVISLFIYNSSAFARLGETEAQSQERYGKPVYYSPDKTSPVFAGAITRTYNLQGWRIRVAFLSGKAIRIYYAKTGSSPRITDDEALAVLKGEQGGGTWKLHKKFFLNPMKNVGHQIQRPKEWINTNNNTSYLTSARQKLVVETPAVKALLKQRAEEAEKNRKKNIPKF